MDISLLSEQSVREILRASEGISPPVGKRRLKERKVALKRGEPTPLEERPMAHPIRRHLQGVAAQSDKTLRTKFVRLDDMVAAFMLLVHTAAGAKVLGSLVPGTYQPLSGRISQLFELAIEFSHPADSSRKRVVRFTVDDQRGYKLTDTPCFALVGARERAGRTHLTIHTFYPDLADSVREGLLACVRADTSVRAR
jgi:hypothetical protein